MLWFSLAILATIAIAFFAILSKYLLKGEKVDPIAYGGLIQAIVGGYCLLILVFTGFHVVINPTSLLLTLLVGFLYALASATYYTAMKHMEVSRLVIILSLEGLFTQVTAFLFLKEPFTEKKIIAATLVVFSVLLVSFSSKTLSLAFSRYDLLAVANGAIFSITSLIDSFLVNNYYSPLTYQAVNFLLPAGLMLIIFRKNAKNIPHLFNWRKKTPLLLATAFLLFLTYVATLNAYNLGGEVSRVVPIMGTQTIIVVILEFFILKERQNLGRKVLSSLLAVAGVYLLA